MRIGQIINKTYKNKNMKKIAEHGDRPTIYESIVSNCLLLMFFIAFFSFFLDSTFPTFKK